MSEQINQSRRKVLQLGSVVTLTLLLSPIVKADELTDLIGDNETNHIVAVRVWPSSVYTRITLEADDALNAKYSMDSDQLQLIIEIKDTQLNSVLSSMPAKVLADDPIIADIKISQADAITVRINVYLKQTIKAQTRILLPVHSGSVNYQYRFVLDMYPVPSTASDKDDLNDDILALLQLQDDNSDIPEHKMLPPSTLLPQPSVNEILNVNQPKNKLSAKLLIMLDPGHGGEDPGAIGSMGTQEKNVVLDIGLRLCQMINSTSHMSAMLTRSQDIFIPLGTRVAIARKAKADIFVSIHADAFTTPLARGASVFVLSDRGASSGFAKWLAKTQNDADLIGGMSYQSKDRMISKVLLDMTQTWTLKKSTKLGQMLLGGLSTVGKLHNNQVEKAAFAVLKAPDIPSVLVETAFISNPEEELKLQQPEFRQKMASTIFAGLNNFVKAL